MLTKCVNCDFFVSESDLICPNCGLSEPKIKLGKNKHSSGDVNYLYAGIAAFAIACLYGFLFQTALLSDIVAIFLILLVIFAIIIFAYSEKQYEKESLRRFSDSGFLAKKKIIQKRLLELNNRQENIKTVLSKIKLTDSANLQSVRSKLLKAQEIVSSQFARYELQAKKIELVRLQNNLAPYLADWKNLDEFQTENGLVTIENTKQEIEKIKQVWATDEFSENVLTEKENFFEQLSETVNSSERLREALLSRQAVRALQSVSTIEENLKLPNADLIVHAAETFNIQTTLTDFSESFDELEREYQRLKAEENINQNLLEN